MTPTALIIVVDRGGLKAYRVNETETRGASLQLVQAFDITDAHGRYDEKLTDQAGRFPVSNGNVARRTRLCKCTQSCDSLRPRVARRAGSLPVREHGPIRDFHAP